MGTLSMRAAFAAAFLTIICPAAYAADANITLQDAHARIMPGAKMGAAYLLINRFAPWMLRDALALAHQLAARW